MTAFQFVLWLLLIVLAAVAILVVGLVWAERKDGER